MSATRPTTVVHCKRDKFDVYIGRPSKWGNPFTHLPSAVKPGMTLVASRGEAITRYRKWIQTQPDLLKDLHELKGQRLGCWCSPQGCHGDVLAELVEASE